MLFAAAGFTFDARICARSSRRSNQTGCSTAAVRAISAAQSVRSAVAAGCQLSPASRLAGASSVRPCPFMGNRLASRLSWRQQGPRGGRAVPGLVPFQARPGASVPAQVPARLGPAGCRRGRCLGVVRHEDDGAALEALPEFCQQGPAGLRVQVGGGLIEQDDVGAGQQCPGDGQPLPFPAAEVRAARTDPGVQAVAGSAAARC